MGNVVHGRFKNYFQDTTGINAYFQFNSGVEIDSKRYLVTNTDVYIVGTQTENPIAQGFGGKRFIFWMKDGTVLNLKDIWHAREYQSGDEVNVVKMENVCVPKKSAKLFSASYDTGVDENEIALFNIPHKMKFDMLSNVLKILKTSDAIALCAEHRDLCRDNFSLLVWERLIQGLYETGKEYVLFMDEARDMIEADLQILKLLYQGNTNFSDYSDFLMESGWQHSMDPCSWILEELKSFYFELVTKQRESGFMSLVLKLRGELISGKSQGRMQMF